MNKYLIFSLFLLFLSCQQKETESAELNVIPMPNHMEMGSGKLDISNGFNVETQNLDPRDAENLLLHIKKAAAVSPSGKKLQLVLQPARASALQADEAYWLKVDKSGVRISAHSPAGLFYGVQSLVQLAENRSALPFVEMEDEPRFQYRGAMIDCSRHFVSLDFLKKQIDLMAHYKLNRFHWHFTDGPGWRIEIKQYPQLTGIAAWRMEPTWKEWWNSGRKYVPEGTPGAYGGYYTQDEARELVRYAADRHITIIPEIEMPGHSEEVLAVYPHLSCTGKPYTSSEFCIGNEQTFEFLENVLTEIIDIFPSELIHVGGDEASREHWEKCPKCQARIKAEGLKDEAGLQSYLITRIEKFLNSKGRRLLGWDEILDGGLAPDATVMSWRGEEGGITAVQSGHDAVMTPAEFCYFDAYQANPGTQPEAMGGFLPIEKVYAYNPVPEVLSVDESKRVLGVQANLWAEHIPAEQHVEYMLYPRLLALAEVAWTQPENKSWADFRLRVNKAIPGLQQKGYNTFTLSDEVDFSHGIDSAANAISVTLSTEKAPVEIRYTTDGSQPGAQSPLYTEPVQVTDSATVAAQLFSGNSAVGPVVTRRFDYHKAIGKKVTYNIPVNPYYPAGGENALVNGLMGGLSHGDGRWQGFMSHGMDVTIDLGSSQPVQSVSGRFMQSISPWIWFPREVVISASEDNETFTELSRVKNTVSEEEPGTLFQHFGWQGSANARFIRYKAVPNGIGGGWVFVDEVVVW
ncbi:MAG: family 20 glycosylhydrolase [Bacteroidia bacterium]|nr:family 20 glycosylhydrolase [Bacteroidia bacterium]